MNRRLFGSAMLSSLLAAQMKNNAVNAAPAQKGSSSKTDDTQPQSARVSIGMLVYPGMFLQDLIGPLTVFEAMKQADIHLLWKDRNPLPQIEEESSGSISVTPTTAFRDCPPRLDVLFVPGGAQGTVRMMQDSEVLSFLRASGEHARFVTSVCTGSLVLGAAGLLKGYRATSHWVMLDVLRALGALPTNGRVVVDRNRMTGGGVTAGLDFGLTLAAKLASRHEAETIQLYLEYAPFPPFRAGTPQTAPKQSVTFLENSFAPLKKAALQTAAQISHEPE